MYNTAHLNIATESFGLLVSVILFILMKIGCDRSNRLDLLFTRLVLINIFMIMCDLLSWVLEGNTAAYSMIAMRAAVFAAYCTPYFFGIILYHYLIELIGKKTGIPKIYSRMVYSFAAANVAFILISLYNGMVYYIDRHNMYHIGELYWLSQTGGLCFGVLLHAIIWRYRKKMKKGETLFLSSYIIVLFAAGAIQLLFFAELELVFTGTTLCLLLMYGGIQMRRQKERELELAESRIAVMLSQIRPHFLYNSLASISDMCKANPEAKEALLTFSEYLRNNMNSLSQTQPIPFETELAHIKQYLWLEQMRYGEKLQVEYDIQTTDFLLPTLSVQPIVENAVRHGLFFNGAGGTVTIRTETAGDCYRVTVTDNGAGFDVNGKMKSGGRSGGQQAGAGQQAVAGQTARARAGQHAGIGQTAHTGPPARAGQHAGTGQHAVAGQPAHAGPPALHIGIESVRSRLAAMCGGSLTIQSSPGEGTTAVISIPK